MDTEYYIFKCDAKITIENEKINPDLFNVANIKDTTGTDIPKVHKFSP